MMSEILIGQSYYLRFDAKLWAAMQPYPPLGALYAVSFLRRRGYSPALFDSMLAGSEAEWAAALARLRPRFAVLYEDNFNYLSKMCLLRMRQAALEMIAAARRHGCTAIVAGPDASDHPQTYLAGGADYVVVGEGELTLAELLDCLSGRSDRPLESLPGLAFRSPGEPSRAVTTGSRPAIQDLDALPFPAWDLVDLQRYREAWRKRHGFFSINLATSRGCPYHCNWCARPIWGQRYHVRSPENVVAELEWLRARCEPDHLWFMDDIFGLKPGWLRRFAELVSSRGARTPFRCLSRADLLLRPGEIEALRQAGCSTVWIGAESGSQKVLDAMEKGIRVEQVYQASRSLHAAGIQVGFFLQFGYPGEGRAEIEQTRRMLRECEPDDIGISVSYPLPGTPFYARVEAQLGERRNWLESQDLAMLYRGPFSTAFYRQLHRIIHKEFRLARASRRIAGRAARPQPAQAGFDRPRLAAGGLLRLGRVLMRAASDHLTLPFDRWKLERLARRPHQGLSALSPALDAHAAAIPSLQEDERG